MNIKHDNYTSEINETDDYSTNFQKQMTNDIRTIKNCAIYFTVISSISLIGGFILLLLS